MATATVSTPRPPINRLHDWDRGPWNRWSFQHVREILPTVEVWRGAGRCGRWRGPKRELGRPADGRLDGDIVTLAAMLEQTYTMASWC